MTTVDLRSDTVTRPTPEMWEAMRAAPVGDDVLGDDPTVTALEKKLAALTGHEAAIYVPSGTMGNQIAIATHTKPGDTFLVEDEAHVLFYEVGAPAVLNGVMPRSVQGDDGVLDPALVEKRMMHGSIHTPGSTLLCIENTHNRAGGTVTSVERHRELREVANRLGLAVHLDGARVFNAATALNVPLKEITQHVDSVSICLSKGLGAPIGSVLCGSQAFIERADFWRKRMGGGMRQSGLLAAAGIYALDHHVHKLPDDHRRCKALAESLGGLPGISAPVPQTNLLIATTYRPAEEWMHALSQHGVETFDIAPNRLRAVFHHQINDEDLERAVDAFKKTALTFNDPRLQ